MAQKSGPENTEWHPPGGHFCATSKATKRVHILEQLIRIDPLRIAPTKRSPDQHQDTPHNQSIRRSTIELNMQDSNQTTKERGRGAASLSGTGLEATA